MSLVDEFIRLVGEFTDASKELKKLSILAVMSSIIGKNAAICYEPKTRLFSGKEENNVSSISISCNSRIDNAVSQIIEKRNERERLREES